MKHLIFFRLKIDIFEIYVIFLINKRSIEFMKNLLKIQSFGSYDASDALALAYHHVLEMKKQKLLSRAISLQATKGRSL